MFHKHSKVPQASQASSEASPQTSLNQLFIQAKQELDKSPKKNKIPAETMMELVQAWVHGGCIGDFQKMAQTHNLPGFDSVRGIISVMEYGGHRALSRALIQNYSIKPQDLLDYYVYLNHLFLNKNKVGEGLLRLDFVHDRIIELSMDCHKQIQGMEKDQAFQAALQRTKKQAMERGDLDSLLALIKLTAIHHESVYCDIVKTWVLADCPAGLQEKTRHIKGFDNILFVVVCLELAKEHVLALTLRQHFNLDDKDLLRYYNGFLMLKEAGINGDIMPGFTAHQKALMNRSYLEARTRELTINTHPGFYATKPTKQHVISSPVMAEQKDELAQEWSEAVCLTQFLERSGETATVKIKLFQAAKHKTEKLMSGKKPHKHSSLEKVIERAIGKEGKTRRDCFSLGWLALIEEKIVLGGNAPECIQKYHRKYAAEQYEVAEAQNLTPQ